MGFSTAAKKDISLCPRPSLSPCHFNNGLAAAGPAGRFDCPGYFGRHRQNNDLQATTFLFHKSQERSLEWMSIEFLAEEEEEKRSFQNAKYGGGGGDQ